MALFERRYRLLRWAGLHILVVLRRTFGGCVCERYFVLREEKQATDLMWELDTSSMTTKRTPNGWVDHSAALKVVDVLAPATVPLPNTGHLILDRDAGGRPYVSNESRTISRFSNTRFQPIELWDLG